MSDRDQRQKMYWTAAWKRIRKEVLKRQPLCQVCRQFNRLTVATVVDHKKPWETTADFYGHGKDIDDHFQGLCPSCHSDKLQDDLKEKRRRKLFKDMVKPCPAHNLLICPIVAPLFL